jgi:hypothetical protein
MNRQKRRAAAAEKRRAERRRDLIAFASSYIAAVAERDESLTGATLITPEGEMIRLDAAALKRGGRA